MKILTWNIFALPWWRTFGISPPEKRIDNIIEILLDLKADIICLQEVFTDTISNKLEIELEKNGYFVISNFITNKKKNFRNYFEPQSYKSGLFFASKIKPIFSEFIPYRNSFGEDSLISKGYGKIQMKDSINNIFLSFNKDLEVFPGHGNTDTVDNILNYNSYLKEFINGTRKI